MASVHAPLNIKCLGADMGWDVIRTPHSTADDDDVMILMMMMMVTMTMTMMMMR